MAKKLWCLMIMLFPLLQPANGATVMLNGVKYTTRGNNEVSCRLADPKDRSCVNVVIMDQIMVDVVPRKVTSIERNGFKDAKYLRSIKLPNTVREIGMNAFAGCENLESIVLPDNSKVDMTVDSYGFGGCGPFKGCVKLREVRGNTLEYPAYVLRAAFSKCTDVPFYSEIPYLSVSMPEEKLPPLTADQNVDAAERAKVKDNKDNKEPESTVDRHIPRTGIESSRKFAVIIGNEKYGDGVAEVEFAKKDARVFADYCHKTLGLPKNNIRRYENATYGDMLGALKDISSIADAYKGDVDILFYYAGHGIPGDRDGSSYIMPVDADGTLTEVCMPLSMLYQRLGGLGARSVLVFLDACFSGSQRGEGMLTAARGVRIKSAATKPLGNMVVFSAATGDQTAYPYKEKGHGIFTYYLLEKLQETKGEVTLGDLYEHVMTNVAQQSVVVNRKMQMPNVSVSSQMLDGWKDIKMK